MRRNSFTTIFSEMRFNNTIIFSIIFIIFFNKKNIIFVIYIFRIIYAIYFKHQFHLGISSVLIKHFLNEILNVYFSKTNYKIRLNNYYYTSKYIFIQAVNS